jgi:hypothetical protein
MANATLLPGTLSFSDFFGLQSIFQFLSHAGFRLDLGGNQAGHKQDSGSEPGQVAQFQAQATVAEFYAYQSVMHQY